MPNDVNSLLLWLTTAGGATAAASFLLGLSPRYVALSPSDQLWAKIVLVVLIAILSQIGITYIPADIKAAISPYIAVVGAVLGGTFISHQATTKGTDVAITRSLRAASRDTDPSEDQ